MRNYWVRIALGALGIFAVGMIGLTLVHRGLAKVNDVVTGKGPISIPLSLIPFQSEVEKIVGFALGTADLLGQMAADDYVEKLPVLYAEFEESARFYEGKMALSSEFSSAGDLVRKTPDFWTKYVLPKIHNEFWGLYRFLNQPHPNGPNQYLQRVEANIEKVRRQLATATAS